jgi:predicted enzyme related to lactoylglutathione lyase
MSADALGIVRGFSGFSVTDIDAARRFYGETLSLGISDAGMGFLAVSLPGGSEVMIYPKPDHRPAEYTILNLAVEDIDAAVDELTERGVAFERYEGFGQDEKGIASPPPDGSGGPRIAWFTDPSGNIIAVLQSEAGSQDT